MWLVSLAPRLLMLLHAISGYDRFVSTSSKQVRLVLCLVSLIVSLKPNASSLWNQFSFYIWIILNPTVEGSESWSYPRDAWRWCWFCNSGSCFSLRSIGIVHWQRFAHSNSLCSLYKTHRCLRLISVVIFTGLTPFLLSWTTSLTMALPHLNQLQTYYAMMVSGKHGIVTCLLHQPYIWSKIDSCVGNEDIDGWRAL